MLARGQFSKVFCGLRNFVIVQLKHHSPGRFRINGNIKLRSEQVVRNVYRIILMHRLTNTFALECARTNGHDILLAFYDIFTGE